MNKLPTKNVFPTVKNMSIFTQLFLPNFSQKHFFQASINSFVLLSPNGSMSDRDLTWLEGRENGVNLVAQVFTFSRPAEVERVH